MNRNDSEINDSIKINLENDEDGKITEFTLNESDVFNWNIFKCYKYCVYWTIVKVFLEFNIWKE